MTAPPPRPQPHPPASPSLSRPPNPSPRPPFRAPRPTRAAALLLALGLSTPFALIALAEALLAFLRLGFS